MTRIYGSGAGLNSMIDSNGLKNQSGKNKTQIEEHV